MRKFLFLAIVFFVFINCKQPQTTTYYLIRHAEKDRTNSTNQDPNLNEDGLKRAEKWATYFKDISLDAVYSTNYKRTQQTAKPTANTKKVEILSYNPRELYAADFKKESFGKSVLIVGHSNTTPAFVNAILGEKKYEDMNDDDNATLFIVTIKGKNKFCKVLKVGL